MIERHDLRRLGELRARVLLEQAQRRRHLREVQRAVDDVGDRHVGRLVAQRIDERTGAAVIGDEVVVPAAGAEVERQLGRDLAEAEAVLGGSDDDKKVSA